MYPDAKQGQIALGWKTLWACLRCDIIFYESDLETGQITVASVAQFMALSAAAIHSLWIRSSMSDTFARKDSERISICWTNVGNLWVVWYWRGMDTGTHRNSTGSSMNVSKELAMTSQLCFQFVPEASKKSPELLKEHLELQTRSIITLFKPWKFDVYKTQKSYF